MASSMPIPVTVCEIRSLNGNERQSIRVALEEYIARHGEDKAWSQKVILETMLEYLFWGR